MTQPHQPPSRDLRAMSCAAGKSRRGVTPAVAGAAHGGVDPVTSDPHGRGWLVADGGHPGRRPRPRQSRPRRHALVHRRLPMLPTPAPTGSDSAPLGQQQVASAPQVWALLRQTSEGPAEPLAVFFDRAAATAAAAELGAGHYLAPCPLLPAGHPVTIAHTWACRVTVVDQSISQVDEPTRLAGASRLLLDGDDVVERAHIDEQAAELESIVHDRRVWFVTGYAATAERARQLAIERAGEITDNRSDP